MPRGTHSDAFKRQFGERFVELVESHLAMGYSDVARAVGYANSSTVLKAARAEGCLDIERLALLATVARADGKTPNLHWLISGRGPALLPEGGASDRESLASLRREVLERLQRLDRNCLEAVLALLGAVGD